MKMKLSVISLIILATFVSLAGCASNTTVHLHANGLSEADRKNIRAGLEEKGFRVVERNNEAPSEDNAILYAPCSGLEKDLYAIENVLANHGLTAGRGFAIQTNQLGKHEYTAGNIGLYVVPAVRQTPAGTQSKIRAVFPISLTDAEFSSSDCETAYGFQFYENGTLTVDDFTLDEDATAIETPSWRSTSDEVVVITNGNEQFEYQKTESHYEQINEYNIHIVTYNIRLRPVEYYRVPFGCSYKSTYAEAP